MENTTRAAVIAVILKDSGSANEVNCILHEYSDMIIGRMGLPYRKKNINIISIAVDGEQDRINTMAGRLGRIEGAATKTIYAPR